MVLRAAVKVTAVAWAFARRGVATYLSYRTKVSLGLASLVLSVVTFSFVAKVVAAAGPGFVERYGMDYLSFVVTGVLVHSVAAAGLGSFRSAVRREQLQGTLELLVTTGVPLPALVLLSGVGELVVVGAGAAAFLALSTLLVGFHIALDPAALAGVVLYSLFMCGIGLASAGTILVSKEGEPISWCLAAATALLGGVYFPIDLLPACLRGVASYLPTTHALTLARSGLAHETGGVRGSLTLLAASAAASALVGLAVLRWGYRRARRSGTLGEY